MVESTISQMNLEALIENLPEMTPNDRALVERAYHKAELSHEGQVRQSGEPYITHCLAVAHFLAEMRLDAETIAAALLHDTLEDGIIDGRRVTEQDLEAEFGQTITRMVDSVTKLTKIKVKQNPQSKRSRDINRELEHIRKMFMAMGDDVRVVLIKLADRLHNMRTLGYLGQHKQQRIARETMDIYAPLANRLGIWQIKSELEDLSFRYLEPEKYKTIVANIDERQTDRDAYVKATADELRAELAQHGLNQVTVTSRTKHIYSIYRKMQQKQLPYEEIYDIRAIRVIVDNVPQCYTALGVVHGLWRPINQEFDDYIAAPKGNFYQSLHTTVMDEKGKSIEVQIRTWEMHQHAEYGIAAHWRYKENNQTYDEHFHRRVNHLRRLMEFEPGEAVDTVAFIDAVKTNVFRDRVYAFTPKGDIIDLPAGATPIDFAYHIHTEIGHRCRGAKIHGKLVSLNYQLQNWDRVEIITSNRGGPSMDWLNPDRGFVVTTRARAKIRYWFRKLNREHHISLGREIVERELKRLGVSNSLTLDSVAALFDYTKQDDFLAAVGRGDINTSQIANRVLDEEQEKHEFPETLLNRKRRPVSSLPDGSIRIMGTSGLLTNIAACCKPAFGDEITGYVTRGRGVTIHRRDCPNILSLADPERLIDVSWGEESEEQLFTVPVEITAYNRKGLMKDISTVIADERVNIGAASVTTHQEIVTFRITLEISNNRQLTRLLSKIEQVSNVVEVFLPK